MTNGTPRPTERSEGGSNKRRTPKRAAVLTEQLVIRVSKPTLIALEEWVAAEPERTVTQAVRLALHQFLTASTVEPIRERFEESP